MRKPVFYTLLLLSVSVFFACSEDDDNPSNPTLDVPETYNFSSFSNNASDAKAVMEDLGDLVTLMKTGRPGEETASDRNQKLSEVALLALYTNNETAPSLSSYATSTYDALVRDWITEMVAASGGVYGTDPEGGVYGGTSGYLLEETGLELEQFIEKGLYGAALYNQAATEHLNTADAVDGLGSSDISVQENNWDNAFVLYGADPAFPNNNSDTYSAKYAARRDNAGFYTAIKEAFLEGRAAITAGEEFEMERDRAASQILENWEKALAATSINYLYSAKSKLLNASTDADEASAFHSWAEAYSFVYGFKGVDSDVRIITDIEINNILGYMKATPEEFTQSNISDIDSAIDAIAQVYGFQDPTIFEVNDVSANNR